MLTFFREVVELLRAITGGTNCGSFFREFYGFGHLFVRIVNFVVGDNTQVVVAFPVLVLALQQSYQRESEV